MIQANERSNLLPKFQACEDASPSHNEDLSPSSPAIYSLPYQDANSTSLRTPKTTDPVSISPLVFEFQDKKCILSFIKFFRAEC